MRYMRGSVLLIRGLSAANAVVSQLRTPLNAIIGMTGLLLESQLTDTQREWLELLEISGNTLLTLVGMHRSITLAK